MPSSKWDPTQYDRFQAERQQPFFDLLALVRRQPGLHAVDLGCGTGELTAILHRELAAAATLGIDRSQTMLARAASYQESGLEFRCVAVESFVPAQPLDLVFSNAALQWSDDHAALFPRLLGWLKPGGQLAVQMPANHDHVSHLWAHALAQQEPFRTWLNGYVRSSPVLPIEAYAEFLDQQGCKEQHVRVQVYAHHVSSRDEVVEWVKGTLLVDYQERLTATQFDEYLRSYREGLLPQLADTSPYFYPFKRILLWARL